MLRPKFCAISFQGIIGEPFRSLGLTLGPIDSRKPEYGFGCIGAVVAVGALAVFH